MNLKHPSRRAFTLIEIMVAMAVFAMVIGAIYSSWVLLMRSTKVAKEVAAQAQRQRITLRTIEDALSSVQSFQASPQYYSFIVENGDSPVLSFASRVPEVFPRNGKFVNPNTDLDFNLRRLTFRLEPGTQGGKDLVLRQNPVLMDMDTDEKQYPLVLAENVLKFSVECWDTNKFNWVDEWDYTNVIPPMVRVNLVLANQFGGKANSPSDENSVTRVISIPSQTMPAFMQRPGGGVRPGFISR